MLKVNTNMNHAINKKGRILRIVLAGIVVISILAILSIYTYIQRKNVIKDAEYVMNQMAEYMAGSISNEIGYAESSIKFAASNVSQSMTSKDIDDPAGIIAPMLENTPFANIEYIRSDGMNVMNIGDPFDASDRVYYIEGIKGNTGIWNNYHPKTSQETLMNFYTPLIYEGEIAGVITGYIEASSQISPLFETSLYGKPIYGIIVDEDNMVICSTSDNEYEYEKDFTLDKYLERLNVSIDRKQEIYGFLNIATEKAMCYKEESGEGRLCVVTIPNTQWKVAIIVPNSSFNGILQENTIVSVLAIAIITLILLAYVAYILLRNVRIRRRIVRENIKLEEDNQHKLIEITEIKDIIASANMGTWHIVLVDGEEPRMFVDETMRELLGIKDKNRSPEQIYNDWFNNIKPEAVQSVLDSVDCMERGEFDENTYLWIHPEKGVRYVRCGGTAEPIDGGFVLRGYHYDVDEVVRKEQSQMAALQRTMKDKNEYYETLSTLEGIFYSMHVIDLTQNTAVQFNAKNEVRDIVTHQNGADLMMKRVMGATMTDEYMDEALLFTDLSTIPERMKDKKIISKQFLGRNIGWILLSFISMETDTEGKPTKVICTTRSINEEKNQEEFLIKKSQTDELTGLLNRRAYEEDIYEHNDIPEEDHFVYVSMDVNGLKVVNDSLGHAAGDELLVGACRCMKNSLGSYGKLYRTGGDEFVAILFCTDDELKKVLSDFDYEIENWSGKLVDSLTISYGCVSKEENPGFSVRQLGALAEQRMYEAKSEHYRKTGVDRRGQQEAHKALCKLYTKILKIDISNDKYQIINMDNTEQTVEKGFSDKISEWLTLFGTTGQVHPDDLKEYLKITNLEYMKEYFAGNKTSLHIFYRRKYTDGFKQVMMEIIPANDYSEDNQSLFLYVKDIDI